MPTSGSTDARPWYLGATSLSTLPWLVRLRWTTAAIEACIALLGSAFPHLDLALDHIALLLIVVAMNNAAFALWMSSGRVLPRPVAAIGLALDMLILTKLLEMTGGPVNPFAAIYVVQVLLASLTLGAWWAAALGGAAVVGISVLAYRSALELAVVHHRLNDIPTHLFTMWIGAVATAELVAHFVVRVSDVLARRERELESMRVRAARSDRLVALTTLAAGAAHELSSPLATIALASRELEHAATARGTVPDLADDARLIRGEVDRCRAILDQMSGRAGGIAADDPALVDLSAVLDDVRARLAPELAARLKVQLPASVRAVRIPRVGFAQVVLSLVKNAFDATIDSASAVIVEVEQSPDGLRVAVHDRGLGFSDTALRHAGEPFFTTKEPGRGLGLGLFLARVFAERLGGTLKLQSDRGAIAILDLPMAAPSMEHA